MRDARRILTVIEKKKGVLNDRSLTADERKAINDSILSYRVIYRELLKTAEHLRQRAEEQSHAA